MFNDSEFPASAESLMNPPGKSKLDEQTAKEWRKIVWKRPREFIGERFIIFDQNIDSCDIIQGTLGNCYFLSALSAMAEYPDRVKRLFTTGNLTNVNFTGCYAVKFHINGKVREVLLDDLFPCLPSRSSSTGFVMAFSKSRGG